MGISLRNLDTFVWVVRLGSFSATGQRLHLSQPAVSMRIRELEDSLGVDLLDRSSSGFRLTDSGRKCITYAERILSLSAELQQQASDASTLAGMVKVGASETIAVTWLPKLISDLSSQYPQILIELEVNVTAALWDRFAKGELDCLLLPSPIRSDDVVAEYLGELNFSWLASPAMSIADKELSPRELGELPIVMLSRGSNLHELIQDWSVSSHVRRRKHFLCNSLSAVIALAKGGVGVALLPEMLVREEIERRTLVSLRVRNPPLGMKYFSIYPTRRANAAVKVISALARQASTFEIHNDGEPI
jgi:DNA-binding transcriptional LysR family regulator